jgi:GNAT superfamily N-acetyltransferase
MLHELRVSATAQQILDLGREMTMESRFARLGFDETLARAFAEKILALPAVIGYGLITPEGELVGMIVGTCSAALPWTDAMVAQQTLLYITPRQRSPWQAAKLIETFVEEAKRRGARDITFSNGTGYQPERVGKLFEICGLPRIGGLYALEV